MKAVLFDFNGVIINDEPIHKQLIEQILIEENLRPNPGEYRQYCLGRSDRNCLSDLLTRRGRMVTESYLNQLIERKAVAYQQQIETMEKLPLYPGLEDFIYQLRVAKLKIAVVTGAVRSEVELVLNRVQLAEYFTVIVAADDVKMGKPQPDGYLLAVERLNQLDADLHLLPSECVAIEDTFAGIAAAKGAGIPVVGISNTYPMHILQRHANWAVDHFWDLELERMQQIFARKFPQPTAI